MDKNYIVELIQQNRLQDAIKAVEKASKGGHLHNQVIMLVSSYAEYTELNLSATEDLETLQMQKAKITSRLLSVLDEIPPEDLEKVTPPPLPKQTSYTPPQATYNAPQATYAAPQAETSKFFGIDKKWAMFGGGAFAVLLLLMMLPSGDGATTDAGTGNTPQTEAVTGRNVRFVEFTNNEGQICYFAETEYGKWDEVHADGAVFSKFQEIKRDDNTIYLRDISREIGVTLELNLAKKEIIYNDDRGKAFVLAKITSCH